INTDMKKDFAKKMRNLVFQHLRFQWGKELFYWKDKAEIDLVLPDGYPVQVAVNEGEIERAVSNLFYYLNQHNQPRGLLVSWNKLQILEENERTVVICPLWIFLSKDENEVRGYGSD
ncbi:MAG: ATP-binding protein, partial [Calditrichaeota bacterium]|nr:ATP-binding protein [Calditrichota bacterium]